MRCLGSDERRDVDECVLEARVLSLGVDQEAMDLLLGPWLGAYVQFDIPHPLEGAAAPRLGLDLHNSWATQCRVQLHTVAYLHCTSAPCSTVYTSPP